MPQYEATFDPIPIDAGTARAYGRIYAATALGAELPLYTCNVADFSDLGSVLEVVAVEPSP